MTWCQIICAPGFEAPPYSVEHYPLGSCVVNARGFSCTHSLSKPGAKFVSSDVAEKLCAAWNALAVDFAAPNN